MKETSSRVPGFTMREFHLPFIEPLDAVTSYGMPDVNYAIPKTVRKVVVAWSGPGWPSMAECHEAIYDAKRRFYVDYEDITLSVKWPRTGDTFAGAVIWP